MTLIGMLNSEATRTASDLQPAFLAVQVQKGEVKLRASTEIPCSSITLTARVESSPPERRARAFLCMASPGAPFRDIELRRVTVQHRLKYASTLAQGAGESKEL